MIENLLKILKCVSVLYVAGNLSSMKSPGSTSSLGTPSPAAPTWQQPSPQQPKAPFGGLYPGKDSTDCLRLMNPLISTCLLSILKIDTITTTACKVLPGILFLLLMVPFSENGSLGGFSGFDISLLVFTVQHHLLYYSILA